MRMVSFSMRTAKNGGYDGYNCLMENDDGTRYTVAAYPRQHAGEAVISKAAFAAVAQERTSRREAQIEQAEEIMKQVAAEKEAAAASEEAVDAEFEDVPEVEASGPSMPLELAEDGPPEADDEPAPVFDEPEYALEDPSLEEAETLPEHLAGYEVPDGDPEMSWLKGEIMLYLHQNKISYDEGMKKTTLLEQLSSRSTD